MPQASTHLRKEWGVYTTEAINYLENHGWILTRQWQWKRLDGRRKPRRKEWRAMCFLIEEWDFGGVE